MRRSDREVTDFNEMIQIMEKCDVCRLAFHNHDYPYIVPLNFGMQIEDGKVALYFHGANEGTKYDLMKKDNRVSFEMDCSHELFMDEQKGSCTMAYESVIGQGVAEIVTDEKKYDGLMVIMKHYHQEAFPFNQDVIPNTAVFRVVADKITGKRRSIKKGKK